MGDGAPKNRQVTWNLRAEDHSCARFQERYGKPLTRARYDLLRSQLEFGLIEVAHQENAGLGAWRMTLLLDGTWVRLIWNPSQKLVRTFLPCARADIKRAYCELAKRRAVNEPARAAS